MSWKDILEEHEPCLHLTPGQRARVKDDFKVLHMTDDWQGREVEVLRLRPLWHHPAGGYATVTDGDEERTLTLAAFEVIGQRDLFDNS